MASPLLIYAATTCRLIADRTRGDPNRKLQRFLEQPSEGQPSKLNATYLPVMNQAFDGLSGQEEEEAMREFRIIVGSIILLPSPLSSSSLARILNTPQDIVDSWLDQFHAVLNVPSSPDLPVTLFHHSLRDFLLRPGGRFNYNESQPWVNEKETHKHLAVHSFRVMDNVLKADICGLKWPGTLRRSNTDPRTINYHLPSEVQYACLHWPFHIQ